MLHTITRLMLWLSAFALTGCAYFSNPPIVQGRDKAYLSANTTPPLRIPPGLSSVAIKNEYPIPNYTYPDSNKTVSTLPPGISS